jgi:Mor family transcriptional regulator
MPKSENRAALDGLFQRLCSDFGEASGFSIIKTIVEELGGLRVSIPDLQDLEREERDRRITSLFNGRNYAELGDRFGLSPRQVRHIVDGKRRKSEI